MCGDNGELGVSILYIFNLRVEGWWGVVESRRLMVMLLLLNNAILVVGCVNVLLWWLPWV